MKKLYSFLLMFILLLVTVQAKDYYGYLVTKIPSPVWDVSIKVNQNVQENYKIINCTLNSFNNLWECNGNGNNFNLVIVGENKKNTYNILVTYYLEKQLYSIPNKNGQPTKEDIINQANKRNIEFHNFYIYNVTGDKKFLYENTEDLSMVNIIVIVAILLMILVIVAILIIKWFKKDDIIENKQSTNTNEEIEKLLKEI